MSGGTRAAGLGSQMGRLEGLEGLEMGLGMEMAVRWVEHNLEWREIHNGKYGRIEVFRSDRNKSLYHTCILACPLHLPNICRHSSCA